MSIVATCGEDRPSSNGSGESCECYYDDNISPISDTPPNVVEFFCTYCGRNGTEQFPPGENPSMYLRKANVCPSCSSSFEKILFQYAYYRGEEEYVPGDLSAVQSAYHYYGQYTPQLLVPVGIQNVYGGALQYCPYASKLQPISYPIVYDGSAILPRLQYTTDVCAAYGNSTQFPLPQVCSAPFQQNVIIDGQGVSGGAVQLPLENGGQLSRDKNPPVQIANPAAEQPPLGQNAASVQATVRVDNENYSSKNLPNAQGGAGDRKFYSASASKHAPKVNTEAAGYNRALIPANLNENRAFVNGPSLAGVSDVKYYPKNKTEMSKNYKKKNAARHFTNGAEDRPPVPAVSKENHTPANRDSNISGLSDVEPNFGCKTRMSKNYVKKDVGAVGDTSHIAHASEDHKSKVNGPRNCNTKHCFSHRKYGFCNYGPRCRYKHD